MDCRSGDGGAGKIYVGWNKDGDKIMETGVRMRKIHKDGLESGRGMWTIYLTSLCSW